MARSTRSAYGLAFSGNRPTVAMSVDTTSDLRYARIYVSALNCPDEKGLLKGLKSAAGYLRHELGSRIDLRYTPELQFFVDDSIAYGAHILDMLNHVKPADPRNADIVLPEDRED